MLIKFVLIFKQKSFFLYLAMMNLQILQMISDGLFIIMLW